MYTKVCISSKYVLWVSKTLLETLFDTSWWLERFSEKGIFLQRHCSNLNNKLQHILTWFLSQQNLRRKLWSVDLVLVNESQMSFERVRKNESLSLFELQQSNYSCSLKLIKMMKTTHFPLLAHQSWSDFFWKKKEQKRNFWNKTPIDFTKNCIIRVSKRKLFLPQLFFSFFQNNPILTHHAIIIRKNLFFELNQSEQNYFCRTLNLIDEDMACKWFVLNVFK